LVFFDLFLFFSSFFLFSFLPFLFPQLQGFSDFFSVYFSGVVVTLLAFCSLILLFFSGQNDKMKNSPQKKRTRGVLTDRDLINTNISKMSELEFRMMIIKILAGLEKSIEDTRETLSRKIKELKSTQVEIKKAINEEQ